MLKSTLLFLMFAILTFSCGKVEDKSEINAQSLHDAMQKLTDVIVHDIFSPPVASRIYVYSSIAAYEVLAQGEAKYKSLAGQLTGLESVPTVENSENISLELASIKAFLTVGRQLVFSEDRILAYEEELYEKFKSQGIPSSKFDASISFGQKMADHIISWSGGDMYKETRTFSKYSIINETDKWKPTPPDYMDGIEPHWNKIRTLVIDSAQQFVPEPPTAFDMDKSSLFYKELIEVYETGKNLSPEQEEIAKFWDCNPYVSHHKGHAMFATKKITPGGHWIGIAKIASMKNDDNMMQAAEAYTWTSIALFDGFISCWDEKWNSLLVRPETLINEFLDEEWMPLLQTPPFPEYTSGHSVVSGAASTVLTHLYGDGFQFDDTTEMIYGLPMRSFNSFKEAADEAAISRLYGGIHYMPAITNGIVQGRTIGSFIQNKLVTGSKPNS